MSSDDFENRLRSQALRGIPEHWRAEILSKACTAARPEPSEHGGWAIWRRALVNALWPCPKAWAGLAAIWLVILGVNVATQDKSKTVAQHTIQSSTVQLMAWKERERLLTELIGPADTTAAVPRKPAGPGPRSERRDEVLFG